MLTKHWIKYTQVDGDISYSALALGLDPRITHVLGVCLPAVVGVLQALGINIVQAHHYVMGYLKGAKDLAIHVA